MMSPRFGKRERKYDSCRGVQYVGQCDESERWREVSEVAFNAWYKAVDLHDLEIQSVKVGESGKVA